MQRNGIFNDNKAQDAKNIPQQNQVNPDVIPNAKPMTQTNPVQHPNIATYPFGRGCP